MFSLILVNILTTYALNMAGYPIDTDAYCDDIITLHEIDLDAAIEATAGLKDADGYSEVDYCF